jgi:hypothetical protein
VRVMPKAASISVKVALAARPSGSGTSTRGGFSGEGVLHAGVVTAAAHDTGFKTWS